jgi:hypothetical protein
MDGGWFAGWGAGAGVGAGVGGLVVGAACGMKWMDGGRKGSRDKKMGFFSLLFLFLCVSSFLLIFFYPVSFPCT